MPVTTAYHARQIPVYYNHQYNSAGIRLETHQFANYGFATPTPRYCFGHRLSYTQFSYSDLKLSKEIGPFRETIEIRVDVENVGSRVGDEVVQLYLRSFMQVYGKTGKRIGRI